MPVLTAGQQQKITDVQAAIGTAVVSDTNAILGNIFVAPQQFGGFNRDFSVTPGETVLHGEIYRVVGFVPGGSQQLDSNLMAVVLGGGFTLAHQLMDPFREDTYMQAIASAASLFDMDMAVLLDHQWWRTITGVLDVLGPIERSEIERTGNVLHCDVDVQVTVDITGL